MTTASPERIDILRSGLDGVEITLHKKLPIMFIFTLIYVLLTSLILTFSSEFTYWYGHEFNIILMILYYSIATYAFLWVIQKFKIQNFPGLFIAATIFSYLVEGGLFGVLLYEGGLFSTWGIIYPPGSHGLISVMLGFYYFRKLMLENRMVSLSMWCIGYGIYWGLWTPAYWLEKSTDFAITEVWPLETFLMYAFFITFFFALSHYLLGWFRSIQFPKWLNITAMIIGLVLLSLTFIGVPFAPLKILPLVGILIFVLVIYKKRQKGNTNMIELLEGKIPLSRVLPLFIMPLIASIIYMFALDSWSMEFIEEYIVTFVAGPQAVLGAVCLVLAIVFSVMVTKPVKIVKK